MICTTFLKESTAIRNALVSGRKLKVLITDKNTVNVLNDTHMEELVLY